MWRREESAAASAQVSRVGPQNNARETILHDHRREQGMRHRNQFRRAMDYAPHQRLASADDVITGEQGTQPVREVDQLRAADAGEEILGSAGEAGNFVGEDRPADQDVIVGEDEAIELDRNSLAEQAAGELGDFFGGNFAEVCESIGAVPVVIEDAVLATFAVRRPRGRPSARVARRSSVGACLARPENRDHGRAGLAHVREFRRAAASACCAYRRESGPARGRRRRGVERGLPRRAGGSDGQRDSLRRGRARLQPAEVRR